MRRDKRTISIGPLGYMNGSKEYLRKRYIVLSREAEDRVLKENLLQHAEHYLRISSKE